MHSVLNESASIPVSPVYKSSLFDAPAPAAPAPQYSQWQIMRKRIQQKWQRFLDESAIWYKLRWSAFFVLLCIYAYRVYTLKGFYIVSYAVGIFLLNRFIGFLSPAQNLDLVSGDNESLLPLSNNEEFRPFLRRVPEFSFWQDCMLSMIFANLATFFPILDMPVYWPILLVYWIVLFVTMMKDRIDHMLKHRYVPFSIGKRTYTANGPATKTGAAAAAAAAATGIRRL